MFKNNYKMYFHEVNNSNWGIESYINIADLSNINDLLYLFKMVKNFTSGMFFLMKNNIKPIYEDKMNINGGVWTFKLSKKYCNDFWKELCYLLCNQKITNKIEDDDIITGI